MPPTSPIKVLMVCTGNICRSPLAECILRHKAVQRGVMDRLHIDSAGVGDWHAGEAPDHRVREVAAVRGVPITGAARQVIRGDLCEFDLLVCMDQTHREHLLSMGADDVKTHLLLRFDPTSHSEDVPDPYYGGREGFVAVFDMIDAACERLLDHILAGGATGVDRWRAGFALHTPAEAIRGFMMGSMHIDPERIAQTERYKLLIGCIVPRPIAWVSTIANDGSSFNLAPFSFFNGVGSNPMTLLFCPANKPDGTEKDSLRNAKPAEEGGAGEFVVNIASHDLAKRMAATSEPLPYGESEFELAGLTMEPSVMVKPPRVRESPVAFECVTTQVVRTNPGGAAGGNIVIGRVVHVFVRDELINERFHIDPVALDSIGRMGGLGYTRTRDRFEMPMGKDAMG